MEVSDNPMGEFLSLHPSAKALNFCLSLVRSLFERVEHIYAKIVPHMAVANVGYGSG